MATLIDQANLSDLLDFRRRVKASIVHTAIQVYNEVANDVQTVTVTGNPTGGTFTLTLQGQITAAIAFNATAGNVRAALEALAGVGVGNVVVTGGPAPGSAFTVTFFGTLAGQPMPVLTATAVLTGGVTPGVAIAHPTTGVAVVFRAARKALASAILKDPDSYTSLFAIGVADTTVIQNDFNLVNAAPAGGVTEATIYTDVNNQVSAIFNAYT